MRFLGPPRSSDSPPRRGRLRMIGRWGGRFLVAVAGLCALVVAALVVVLHSLDQAWLKRRIQTAARGSAGLDIDYRSARIDLFSGAAIEGLVVRSPEEIRPFAPDLVRVESVNARWRLTSLLHHEPILERLAVSGLTLTLVVDEHGRTSFDAIPSGPAPPPSPPVPLSRQAASLLGTALPVGQITVDGVTLALVKTEEGKVAERTELRGVAFALAATSAAPAEKGARVKAGLGSPASPLDLKLTRTRGSTEASARAKLWLAVDATSSALTAALDLGVPEQSFAPTVTADHWVHAEAAVKFDPGAGRTTITLDHTEAGDGARAAGAVSPARSAAASAEAAVDVPDVGDPIVRHAQGDLDLARMLRWVPAGLIPVTADTARVHYRIDGLVAGPVVRLSVGGSATLDVDLSKVEVTAGGGPIGIGQAKASLHAQPADGGGIAGSGSIALVGTAITSGAVRLAVDDIHLDFDARQGGDGAIGGRAGLRFGRLTEDGATPVVASSGQIELHLDGLHPGEGDPLTTRGDIALSFDLASLDARPPSGHVTIDGLTLHAHTRLDGHAPYAAELDAPLSRLRVRAPDGTLLLDAPVRIETAVHAVVPDLNHPEASQGIARVAVDVGVAETKASIDLTKKADAVDFALQADVPSLRRARPFLPPALVKAAPWDQIGIVLRSSGRADRISGGAPALDETTELEIKRPAFEQTAAQSIALKLTSKGTALSQEASVDLRALGLAIDGGKPEDDHAWLSLAFNREHAAPSVHLQLETEGRASSKISASASFDPAKHALPYEIDAHLGALSPLAPFLAKVHGLDGFDLSQLELAFSSRGAVLGVVAAVGRDGSVQLEPNPARTGGIEGKADFRVGHFQWTHGTTGIIAPAIAWHGDLHAAGERRTVDSHLEAGALHLDLGPHDVDLTDIRHDSSVSVTGDVADPESEVTQRTSIRAVQQDFVPEYPIGDMSFALTAERDHAGVVHLTDLKLANGAGGTTLALTGNLDLGDGRRTLSVTTALGQDLGSLTHGSPRISARGKLAVEANVTSPDLALFRVRAALKADDVFFKLASAGLDLEAATGEIPVTVALEVGKNGVSLRADEKRSPYSMLRFADQHPLLNRSGFLSIASLKTPFVTIAPLVGNLEIEQNVISLRQFEMGVHKGTITGQCSLDWDGPRSTVELHVRASGVQSSHGEPFDGNIAVVISAADRTVEGRAEILRIGERHLLDLLDLQDPTHVDPAINRVRSLLNFGYPDTMRVSFDHGFASVHLKFGGLARIVSVDLHGIPMGPLIDQMLSPVLDGARSPAPNDSEPDDAAAPDAGQPGRPETGKTP